MEISSVNQAQVFLWMVACGVVCTLVFDVFRGIRRYKSPQNSVILFQDLALWAIEICIVYVVAFKLNYAKVRAYEIVALVIGSLLYFIILSDYIVKTVCRIAGFTEKCMLWLVTPFKKLCSCIVNPVKKHMLKVAGRLRVWCNEKRRGLSRRFDNLKNLFSKSPSEREMRAKSQKNS